MLTSFTSLTRINKYKFNGLRLKAFGFATIISIANWYYQTHQENARSKRQNQLINRVLNNETADNFLFNFHYHKADDWQCKKVQINCELLSDRFLIKRKRGDKQGYLIMAPIIIDRDRNFFQTKDNARQFTLCLGWIARQSKHLAAQSLKEDILQNKISNDDDDDDDDDDGENEIRFFKKDGSVKDINDPNFFQNYTKISAYIRRGEHQDLLRGYRFFQKAQLYKYIDLPFLSKVFKMNTNGAENSVVYFDRVFPSDEDSEVFPMPINKQRLVSDLMNQVAYNNQAKIRNTQIGFATTFLTAALLSMV